MPQALLELLSDGEFHSGQEMASRLKLTRAAVWKRIHQFEEMGLELFAVRGKGYRLASPLDLLDADRITDALPAATRAQLERLEVFPYLGSTNTHLLNAEAPADGKARVCLAEYQSAGRGRRGATWRAAFASSVCLSLSWAFREQPPHFGGLSLVIGVALIRALRALEVPGIGLKWPNDLVSARRKLGGTLIELQGEGGGPTHVVIGIGINVRLSARQHQEIGRLGGMRTTDLAAIGIGRAPGRNPLAAQVIEELVRVMPAFSTDGLAPFLDEWRGYDAFADRHVTLLFNGLKLPGIARGVDASGSLLLERKDGDLERYRSGEVSVRAPR